MPGRSVFRLAVVLGVTLLVGSAPTFAQSTANQPSAADQKAEAEKDAKRINEFVEASRILKGPAANPECVWLGRRVVNLLWRDDLDTAFRHLDLYDRFGCPASHIQSTFRCLVRQGNIDPKAAESLSGRVHGCWINPEVTPAAAAPTPAAGSSGNP